MRTEGEVLPPGGMGQQVGINWRKRLIPEILIATFTFGRRSIMATMLQRQWIREREGGCGTVRRVPSSHVRGSKRISVHLLCLMVMHFGDSTALPRIRKGWDSNPRWVAPRSISSRVP
jgi:hypothetical protein